MLVANAASASVLALVPVSTKALFATAYRSSCFFKVESYVVARAAASFVALAIVSFAAANCAAASVAAFSASAFSIFA